MQLSTLPLQLSCESIDMSVMMSKLRVKLMLYHEIAVGLCTHIIIKLSLMNEFYHSN
jgi:hypothetical protein